MEVKDFLESLKAMIEDSKIALKDLGAIQLGVEADLKRIYHRLSFVSGSNNSALESAPEFKPVTNFMGTELKLGKEIKTDDMTPQQLEVKIFREKGDRLKASIFDLTNEQIFESYKSDYDKKVIRLVAKMSGVENYKDGEINDEFLENIRLAIKSQEEFEIKKKKTDAATA